MHKEELKQKSNKKRWCCITPCAITSVVTIPAQHEIVWFQIIAIPPPQVFCLKPTPPPALNVCMPNISLLKLQCVKFDIFSIFGGNACKVIEKVCVWSKKNRFVSLSNLFSFFIFTQPRHSATRQQYFSWWLPVFASHMYFNF